MMVSVPNDPNSPNSPNSHIMCTADIMTVPKPSSVIALITLIAFDKRGKRRLTADKIVAPIPNAVINDP